MNQVRAGRGPRAEETAHVGNDCTYLWHQKKTQAARAQNMSGTVGQMRLKEERWAKQAL